MKLKGIRLFTCGLASSLLALGTVVSGRAETPRAEETAEAMMRRATAAERAQRTAEAAAAYESLLRRDTAFEAVVSPRLVTLYADSGQTAQALSWAVRVSRRQPDPKAYLAGVYARLGQWKESELLLRQAAQGERDPRKRAALQWQLADIQERLGDGPAALATLAGTRDAAPDEEFQRTSVQRLDALRRRLAAAPAKPPPSRCKTKAEDTP
jgi:tetratricopeptide (TPR) repeat protein